MVMLVKVKVMANKTKNYLLQPWKECEMKVIR